MKLKDIPIFVIKDNMLMPNPEMALLFYQSYGIPSKIFYNWCLDLYNKKIKEKV